MRLLLLAFVVLAFAGCGGEEAEHGKPLTTPTHTGPAEREIAP